jgi:hypothetical protein
MKKTILHTTVLADIAVLIAGCAVLTVDVDVYKGPLANHEDIQMEQMAAMAIGAKPLLVELRDIIEAEHEYWREFEKEDKKWYAFLKVFKSKDLEKRLSYLRETSWYRPEYIWPYWSENNRMESRFRSSDADNVNNILCLYYDRGNEQYSLFMRRIWQADRDYKIAYNILRPDSNEADIKRWKKLELKPDSFEKKAKNLLPEDSSREDIKKLSKRIEKLRNEYEHFYTDPNREAKELLKSWYDIRDQLGEKVPYALRDNRLLKGKDDELKKSPNAQAYAFDNSELVDFHAEHLFGLKDKKKDDFVDHVKKISQAFIDSRDALERLWRVEMEVIIWLSDKQEKASTDWKRHIYVIAKASLEVIQPRYVAVFLELNALKKDSREDIPKEVDYLSELLPKLTKSELAGGKRSRYWSSSSHYKDAKAIFLAEFIRRPTEIAKGLLACHKYCKSELDPNILNTSESTKTTSLQYISGWKFGLVRAPFDPEVPEEVFIQRNLAQYTQELGGGAFAGGRLDKGLECLIEDYLNLADEPARGESQERKLEVARQALSDALVRFAKKLLFLANNRSLISPPKEPGLVTGTLDILSRGLFGERVKGDATDLLGWSEAGTNQYTRILQAVGNSIVVQADALQQERKHRERLEDHYEKEVAILDDTLSRMSPVHRRTVGIESVDGILSHEKPTAKDVRDVWIELLEYEHDLALYYGKAQRAKEIAEALAEARKKREGMIFIRPAMAYLRTSFPATSLQSNPNLTWDNMLGGHMMRSIPFGPQMDEFLNLDAKRDARITAEIDKQFWQNINRVRVAGGGFTNYAVVKDDIGNWYVKGYSANPEDVIKSAKNLAMFAAGAEAGANLLHGAGSDEKVGEGKVAEDGAGWSGLERVFAEYQDNYTKQTLDDYSRVKDMLKSPKLEDQIRKSWRQNKDITLNVADNTFEQLNTQLAGAVETHLKPVRKKLKQKVKTAPEQASLILEALGALRRFHNRLVSGIKGLNLAGQGLTEASEGSGLVEEAVLESQRGRRAEAGAVNAVKSAVCNRVLEILDQRRDAIDDYQTALVVIGQAGGQQE